MNFQQRLGAQNQIPGSTLSSLSGQLAVHHCPSKRKLWVTVPRRHQGRQLKTLVQQLEAPGFDLLERK